MTRGTDLISRVSSEIGAKPLGTIAAVVSAFGSVSTIFGFASSIGGASHRFSDAPVPFALAIFLASSAALGWTFGWLTHLLTLRNQEFQIVLSHLVAVFWAMLLVGWAEALFPAQGTNDASETIYIFAVIMGLGVSLWLARTNLRNLGLVPARTNALRAATLCSFAAGMFFISMVISVQRLF